MKFLARVFASAVVRRLAYVLVALVLAWCGVGKAHAAGSTDCANTGNNCTRQEAYAAASWFAANESPQYCAGIGQGFVSAPITVQTTNVPKYYYVNTNCTITQNASLGNRTKYFISTECPAGTTWSEATKTCHNAQQCLAKPARTGGWYTGAAPMCMDGCQFSSPTSGMTLTVAGKTYRSLAGSAPTGEACVNSPANAPLPEQTQYCEPVGTLSVCLKANTGEHCYTASTGRQICWQPGETGEKNDADVRQKRNAGPDAIPPASLQLPSGDTLQQSGNPATTTTTITNNNSTTTITTTTTNYKTANGTNANGSTGGNGESGTGDGSGKTGDGDGDSPGGVGDGAGEGDFYEGSDKTLESVFAEYKARIEDAPIMQAATNFVTISVSGGCPVWTVPATEYWDTLVFDYHCSGTLATALAQAGWVFMALAAWAAFKIGFL